MADAQWISRYFNLNAFISCQDESAFWHGILGRDLIPAMKQSGSAPLFFPRCGTSLGPIQTPPLPEGTRLATASYAKRFTTEANFQIVEGIEEFCNKRGHGLLELACSWIAANPLVSSVIAGATRLEQVEQNVRAVDWALTPDDLAEDRPAHQDSERLRAASEFPHYLAALFLNH